MTRDFNKHSLGHQNYCDCTFRGWRNRQPFGTQPPLACWVTWRSKNPTMLLRRWPLAACAKLPGASSVIGSRALIVLGPQACVTPRRSTFVAREQGRRCLESEPRPDGYHLLRGEDGIDNFDRMRIGESQSARELPPKGSRVRRRVRVVRSDHTSDQ
jgi:hypothetical protein